MSSQKFGCFLWRKLNTVGRHTLLGSRSVDSSWLQSPWDERLPCIAATGPCFSCFIRQLAVVGLRTGPLLPPTPLCRLCSILRARCEATWASCWRICSWRRHCLPAPWGKDLSIISASGSESFSAAIAAVDWRATHTRCMSVSWWPVSKGRRKLFVRRRWKRLRLNKVVDEDECRRGEGVEGLFKNMDPLSMLLRSLKVPSAVHRLL